MAAQAAAALTPGHDDAMAGIGGDTLRDVHRCLETAGAGTAVQVASGSRPVETTTCRRPAASAGRVLSSVGSSA